MNPFKGVKVLIIGDVCLDRYVEGRITRKSPESDAMVFRKFRSHTKLGMAGNVAQNVKALGGVPTLLSVVGTKGPYKLIKNHLMASGIEFDFVYHKNRKTTLKTRIHDGEKDLLRVDEEDTESIDSHYQNILLASVREHIKNTDVVILQDYGKGVLYEKVIQETISCAHSIGKKVFIDPNRHTSPKWYRGADFITPNVSEALALTKCSSYRASAQFLRKEHNITNVIVTAGEIGMLLVSDTRSKHFFTESKKPVDVTGAGDTVVSVLALSQAIGLSIEKSIRLANIAGGIVIGKRGASTCTFEELSSQ